MSGFDAAWLSLREDADARARAANVADALAARFATRQVIRVVDLGCGTGANLRATSPHLPNDQTWQLVDRDPVLIAAARTALRDWADHSTERADTLVLQKDGRHIDVTFQTSDLTAVVSNLVSQNTDLVTASALFDLASRDFVRALASSITAHRCVFHTVMTYNGRVTLTPRHTSDVTVLSAFHRHQLTDKGFGPALGPTAPDYLADQFRLQGYAVVEGDSAWELATTPESTASNRDGNLLTAYLDGVRDAVAENDAVPVATRDAWRNAPRVRVSVGHTDTLATPA